MSETASLAPIAAALTGANIDPAVRELMERPFEIQRPDRWSAPFVFTSPHSGDIYPESFVASSKLDAVALRRSEDAFVDELFEAAPRYGACLLRARFPRAYVDVNRAESELDPEMFEGGEGSTRASSARVNAGLGVIPRVVRDGVEIYPGRLPVAEAAFRLEAFYRPYHATLSALLDEAKERFGTAILIDCHSMPPVAPGHDVVLGDRHGAACAPILSDGIEAAILDAGFSVARNNPYAGGYTTSHYGRPANHAHAVQIELNRGLYLTEKSVEKSAGFPLCQQAVERFVARLLGQSLPL
jgi:N-formylglutamate amidohydrolase